MRSYATGLIADASVLRMNAAATTRLTEWLFMGGEVRYVRAFEGLALGTLVGQAIFAGPTFYITLGQSTSLSGAWNMQAWGQAAGQPPGLDLTFFERQTFKVRLAFDSNGKTPPRGPLEVGERRRNAAP